MWTGRQTLGEIEGAIAKLHRDETELDGALGSAGVVADRLRRERSEVLRELARIKLGEIEAGRLVSNLDAAERRAMQILEGHRLQLAAANDQRAAAIAEVERAEADRHTAAAAVEKALEAVEAVRLQAEANVRSTPTWLDVSKAVAAADAIAQEAEKKAAQSEDELGRKKKLYDDDPLFAYLWRSGFGTPKYQASSIVRMVDRMVAEFIGFAEARPNYAMLTEITLRLREHATSMRTELDERKAILGGIERQAMLKAGIEPKERALAEARYRLASADDMTEKKRGLLQSLDEQRNALVNAGNDGAYAEALQTIAMADAQDDIVTLRREAQRTATPDDDTIVRRLSELDEGIDRADRELAQLRASAQDLSQRRLEIERVRDRFRSAGFDHPNARFGNESEIGNVLGQILEGAVRSGILWDILRGGFGTRPSHGQPEFGAPSFPFPFPLPGNGNEGARGGQWRDPGTRGGWSPPLDLPTDAGRSSGSDDERFSTGGSF